MAKSYGGSRIPHDLLSDPDLTWAEKTLLGRILVLSDNEHGYCFSSNLSLSTDLGLSKSSISRRVSKLERDGYLVTQSNDDGVGDRQMWVPKSAFAMQKLHCPNAESEEDTVYTTSSKDKRDVENVESETDEKEKILDRLWDIYLDELGGDGRQPDLLAQRKKKLWAMYEEQLSQAKDPFTAFRTVCETLKASEFHMSKRSYQLPESFLRNETKRERWFLDAADFARSGGKTRMDETPGSERSQPYPYEEWEG